MKFCKLESDGKSFEYFKKYINLLENGDIHDILKIDNIIQKLEIEEHCVRNNKCSEVNSEAMYWISNWAEDFRAYLSTLKIMVLIFECTNKQIQDMTWEEFCNLESRINKMKPLLDTIF